MLPFPLKRLVFALVFFCCAVLTMAKLGPAGSAETGPPADPYTVAAGTTPTVTPTETPCGSAGSLDPSFGNGGFVSTQIGSPDDRANAVVIQPDGKIVTAGATLNQKGTTSDFALTRYNPDGSPDTSFGTNGYVITNFSTGSSYANALAIQPDGKIVVAGGAAFLSRDTTRTARSTLPLALMDNWSRRCMMPTPSRSNRTAR